MIISSGVVDANVSGGQAIELTLTTETRVGLFILGQAGDHNNHEFCIEASPDDVDWFKLPGITRGEFPIFTDVIAQKVRVCTLKTEGSSSQVKATIVAI